MTYLLDDFPQEHPNGFGILFQHVVWQAMRLRPAKFYVDIIKSNCPYREAGRGSNVWEYYFDQAPLVGPCVEAPVEMPLDVPLSGHRDWTVERQRAIQPFAAEHFRLRPEIQAEVDSFKKQFFKGRVLAVLARGTDKASEYLPMRPDQMIPQIRAIKERTKCDTVFLMTDCVLYHEQLTHHLGACSLTIPRGKLSLHHNPPCGPFRAGLWMIIDSWLAAAANVIMYTPANSAVPALVMGKHEEIHRLNRSCEIMPFCPRVDRVLGLTGGAS